MLFKRLIIFLLLSSSALFVEGQTPSLRQGFGGQSTSLRQGFGWQRSDLLLNELIKQYGQVTVTIPVASVPSMTELTRNVSISSVKDKTVTIVLTGNTINWFTSNHFDYKIVERTTLKGLNTAKTFIDAMNWQVYPSYTQYDSIMRYFSTTYPAICRLDTIGTSISGRQVLVLKISDNVATSEDEPEVFYSSSMHGDELGGFVLMLRLADYITKNYASSAEVKLLVNNLEIWINPLANPDGTYGLGNTISNPTRGNARGIDLNRNFPDPSYPFQVLEKETIDMVAFMKDHNFVLSANFHSGSEVVNYPWDKWLSQIHADDNWFNTVSRAYADTVHLHSGPAYMNDLDNGVTRGAVWYIVYGGRQDYITYERQGREVTIELDAIKETPAAQLELLWQYNHRSLINYLKNGLYGVHGTVKDYNTDESIVAKVFIAGHDKDSSHVYSNESYGRFVRLLSPGIYDLRFSSPGYRDTIVEDVNVSEGVRTDLSLKMQSIASKIDTNFTNNPLLFPNPTTQIVNVLLPQEISGSVNIRIIDQIGRTVQSFNKFFIENEPIKLDLSKIPAGVYIVIFTGSKSGITTREKLVISKH